MSSKSAKDYDATVARMVGNMLAGHPSSWFNGPIGSLIDKAIETALLVRKKLRKHAKEEDNQA